MKAAVLSLNLEAPEEDGAMYTVFEGPNCTDRCHALIRSMGAEPGKPAPAESDWPGTIFTIVADEEARQDRAERMLGYLYGVLRK